MHQKKPFLWRLCCAGAILTSILSFSPLVLPPGVFTPKLGPVPYSLWMGILLTIFLVLLTYLGARVHPGHKEEGKI
ncbi:MAG: hypothetical protein AAF694_00345 [Bacteroidota bacterium]